METARTGLRVQLESFTANAAEHLRRERDLLLDGAGIPATQTVLDGRPVLVVVAGSGWEQDVTALRHWIREAHPVLIGVDEGADALLHLGHRPDIVIGELDSVSDLALTCGAELVLHVARDGRAPALHRLEELGAEHTVFRATGTGEDLALLLADAGGADLVALAGSHTTLTEFIDHGRAQMPGAFLVRLRLGSKLVDARTVAAVHQRRPAAWPLVLLMVLAVAGLVATVALTGLDTFEGTVLGDWWDSAYAWAQGLSDVTGFRYHALALASAVVTLAVGVVVGVGPLSQAQTTKHTQQTTALQHREAGLRERLATPAPAPRTIMRWPRPLPDRSRPTGSRAAPSSWSPHPARTRRSCAAPRPTSSWPARR